MPPAITHEQFSHVITGGYLVFILNLDQLVQEHRYCHPLLRMKIQYLF